MEKLIEERKIILDNFGNPIGDSNKLKNINGSKILIGKFFSGEGFTAKSFDDNSGNDLK